MNPLDVLYRIPDSIARGQYVSALDDLIWFHDHAPEHAKGMGAVRLSYALFDWVELGKVYPPAQAALLAVRDRKTAVLSSGGGDWNLFHDVESINEVLQEEWATYALFRAIDARWPEMARRGASLATPAMLKAGDFDLARKYMPDPLVTIRHAAEMINRLAARPHGDVERAEVEVDFYVESVRQVLAVLQGRGEHELAQQVRQMAVREVTFAPVRAAVEQKLAAVSASGCS